jgi:hypothetical protein
MFEQVKEFFENAWKFIQALWKKHDEQIGTIVSAILPLVIGMAVRYDLSGEEKRKAILDAILDNAELDVTKISTSVLNEAIEIAVNRYNIQIGQLTKDELDNALTAALKAARDYADGKLSLGGSEAEAAGVTLGETLSDTTPE